MTIAMSDSQPRIPQTAQEAATRQTRTIVVELCRRALEDYRQAGYPFGKSMDGMLIWFEHGQHTTDN